MMICIGEAFAIQRPLLADIVEKVRGYLSYRPFEPRTCLALEACRWRLMAAEMATMRLSRFGVRPSASSGPGVLGSGRLRQAGTRPLRRLDPSDAGERAEGFA